MAQHLTRAGVGVLGTYNRGSQEASAAADVVFCRLDVTRIDAFGEFVITVRGLRRDRPGPVRPAWGRARQDRWGAARPVGCGKTGAVRRGGRGGADRRRDVAG
jgi:hypothetical protein